MVRRRLSPRFANDIVRVTAWLLLATAALAALPVAHGVVQVTVARAIADQGDL